MEGTPLLPLPDGMLIDQVQLTETGLRIAVIATHPTSRCPLCSELSSSIHSRYSRILRDVPCGGRQVQLVLTVRKFFCRNALCPRKVFDSTNTPVCGALGADDYPALSVPAIHRLSYLWQRRGQARCTFRHAHLSLHHPAPHYGPA